MLNSISVFELERFSKFAATAVAANLKKLENTKTEIEFNLGKLLISIDENKIISMRGPVSEIEEIKINI